MTDRPTVEEAEAELEPLTAEIACGLTVRQKAALRVLLDRKGVALTELPEPDRKNTEGALWEGDDFEVTLHPDNMVEVWLSMRFALNPVELALSLLAAHARRATSSRPGMREEAP